MKSEEITSAQNVSNEYVRQVAEQKYEFGFTTDVHTEIIEKGLNEDVVRLISAKKGEPEWMLDFRLKAFRYWEQQQEPKWGHVHVPSIDYQAISYYADPMAKKPAGDGKIDPELEKTFDKLGIPLEERLALSGNVAVDAIMDSVSVKTTFKEKLAELGVIFCSIGDAIKQHPELVREYLGTVVPYRDNFFAALNSAVFSDGSFVYIPKGVRCPMELSSYFRINARNTGQFERTLIIADDDAGMRLIERKIIEKAEGFELIGEAVDGLQLLSLVEEKRPNVVFLDVEMPGKTGVECGRQIQDLDPSIIMIFATAHDQYMGDAFEVYAFDYLIKPFKVERVLQTLDRIRGRFLQDETPLPPLRHPTAQATGRLMLRHKDGVSFIAMNDILLIQREDRSTVIYTEGGGRYMTSDTLSETEARLDPQVFFRCHKSYIINLNKITDITPYGRWTYVVHLSGTRQDALITHEKYEELEKMFS